MLKLISILSLFLLQIIYADCLDILDQATCEYWGDYCQWNSETSQCESIDGGGGDDTEYGPYEFDSITQSDGMQDSPLYADVTLYYPIDAVLPYSTIVLGAGWGGDQSSMADWAYYFASYGIVTATIQYNDPSNDSHQYRSESILELIEAIKQEHTRIGSPVNGNLDTNSFAALGYSLSGGVVQLSAVLDSTLDAVIALNPTIIVEDCELCASSDYCICLVPEFLDHSVPTLIISGENEINELPSYEGLLGSDQYENTPIATEKMLYEIANGGHGSAAYPGSTNGIPGKFALNWIKYYLHGDQTYCDSLLAPPDNASQFLTTITCDQSPEQGIIEISSGTSFGECLGYCFSDLVINQEQVNYELYGWDQNDPIHLPIEIEDTFDIESWQNLVASLDTDAFMSLDNEIGCPDCSDGGAEWFEIVVDDMIKRVTIEYGTSVDGFDGFIEDIRAIRQGFEDIQRCYFTPNTGECDAAFQRYYYDEEEQECMTFTWGGCGGLVPFETFEECESSCSYDGEQGSAVTGYLRASELSFCMDNCGLYYVEDENGNFISNVSNLNNYIEQFNYYIDRFVEIEGDNIQCVECSAINVSSITISGDCENPVSCLVDPCSVSNCGEDANLNCVSNYCDGCYADYYDIDDLVICNTPTGVVDLTDVDFGDCEMLLGFGWVSNHCQAVSGCSFTVDSINYSGALFSSIDECVNATTLEVDQIYPNDFHVHQNYPNPFNPVTSITYQIPFDADVNITIYDMSGRVIKTLLDGKQSAGHKSILWNAKDNKNEPVSAGIYLYTIKAGNYRKTRKMVLIK